VRIFLIQHGLEDRHTHFYGETLGWIRELRRRGIGFRLFAQRGAAPDIVAECGAEPLFPFAPGARVRKDPVSDRLETFLRFGAEFGKGCTAMGGDIAAQDLVIVAFATERELFGVSQWLRSVPAEKRPRIVFIHLIPDFDWKISDDGLSITGDMSFHRFAAHQMAEVSDRFHLFASSEKLGKALTGAYGRPCAVAPVPLAYFDAQDVPGAPGDPDWPQAHIGVVGDFRE